MEVQYILDSSAELAETTPLECASLYLLTPAYEKVQCLINENRQMPDDFLQNTARYALARAPNALQHWVALNSLRYVGRLTQCIKERAEYLVQAKIQKDLFNAPRYSLLPGLAEEESAFWSEKMVETESDITETCVRALLMKHMGGYIARLNQDVALIDKALAWYQKDNGEQFRKMQGTHRATKNDRTVQFDPVALLSALNKSRIENKKPARKAIKKVTKLFSQFKQEKNLQLFVSGQEVVLTPPDSDIKFVLRPLGEPGWLEDRSVNGGSHTPYDLSLLTTDDIFIARLCVYFTDTPVLDQLLALTMFVQAGEELKVLEKANFFSFNEEKGKAGKEVLLARYPSLASKFPATRLGAEDGLDLAVMGDAPQRISLGREFEERQEQWEPYHGRVKAWVNTWFSPVFSQLLPKAELLALPA